jgi:hypothetical protein
MDFIVNNWLVFGLAFVSFIVALYVNFATMMAKMKITTRGVYLYFFFGLMAFLTGVPFIIGAIIRIVGFVSKENS